MVIFLFMCMLCMLGHAPTLLLVSNSLPPMAQAVSTPVSIPVTVNNRNPFRPFRNQFNWRLSLAGGLAGGFSSALLFPMDTLKTMRQADPSVQSTRQAVHKIKQIGLSKIYAGVVPASVGSMFSSALYFGSYETCKSVLTRLPALADSSRPLVHMLSAACGNVISSVVFVPKDIIKQQMQAARTGSLRMAANSQLLQHASISTRELCERIFRERGLRGFYTNYRATLMRNIPSAVIRFTVYEELKSWAEQSPDKVMKPHGPTYLVWPQQAFNRLGSHNLHLRYLVAGCLASGLSSVAITPIDVVKTRLATGMIAPGTPVFRALFEIARLEGVRGLYAGAGIRITFATVFGGVGFSTYEACKQLVGAQHNVPGNRR